MDFVRPIEAVIPGAQGRVLAVLAETTAEMNLRTVARLSGVSHAQVSRVLPRLVQLGLVERREAPPSSLFRLVPEHVAAGPLVALARGRDGVVEEMGRVAVTLPMTPESVIVFGSFARGEADAEAISMLCSPVPPVSTTLTRHGRTRSSCGDPGSIESVGTR